MAIYSNALTMEINRRLLIICVLQVQLLDLKESSSKSENSAINSALS